MATSHNNPSRPVMHGIILVVAAFCVLPIFDGIAKVLIRDYPVAQVVWARLVFQTIVVIVWLTIRGRLRFSPGEQKVTLALAVTAIWLANFPIVFALQYMALADAFALIMTTPLMVTALAAFVLREPVSPRHWTAVGVGFVGALVIVRPGSGVFQTIALLPLLSAGLFAAYQIAIRYLGRSLEASDILLFSSVLPAIGSSFLLPMFWVTPDPRAWLLMMVMGGGAALGHFLLIKAYTLTRASLLAPFIYVQILSSALFGLVVFADWPDNATLVGAAIIIASGLYGMYLARRN